MHPGSAPHTSRAHTPRARASSRAWWLGVCLCALLVGGLIMAARTERSAPRPLSATVAGAEPATPTSPSRDAHPASVAAPRRAPVSGGVDDAARGAVVEGFAASDSASLVVGRVVVLGGSGAEEPIAQARLYVEAQRRSVDGSLGIWATTPLRALSDDSGRFSITRPAEGTIEAEAIAPSTRQGQQLVGLRVTARSIGLVDTSAEFEPGAADVQLALARVGSLAVRIVHGGAEVGPRFSLELIAGDERFVRAKVTHEREIFSGVPAGNASLMIRLQGDPEPLIVLQNLVVPSGAACVDPRLDPLVVSGRFAAYAVRVVNYRGEVVEEPKFAVVGDVLGHVDDQARSGLRAQPDAGVPDVGESEELGSGWWQVHARAPAAPTVVVSAVDHHPSQRSKLVAGTTIVLRPRRHFFIELAGDPPPGTVRVELEALVSEAPAWRHLALPAQKIMQVPRFVTGRVRARLVVAGLDAPGSLDWHHAAEGPWVEFVIPASGEGRVLLDLTF